MRHIEIKSDFELKKMQELEYKQSHDLTEARMVTTAAEYDLLSMIVANYKGGETLYRIHIKDIEYITGRSWNYRQLADATEKMGGHMFQLQLPDRKRQLWLFSSVDYLEGLGTVEIDINPKALFLIENIKESGYTSVQLKSTLSLTSMYAKRIYALCCKWSSTNGHEYSLDELRRILNLVDAKTGEITYERMFDFKKRVLEPAKQQINEHTNIEFDYEMIKKYRSRSFNAVRFYVNKEKPKKDIQTVIEFGFTTEQQKFIKDLVVYGFTEYQAEKIAPIVTPEQFKELTIDLNQQIRNKKVDVKNGIAYLCGVLKNKYKISGLVSEK